MTEPHPQPTTGELGARLHDRTGLELARMLRGHEVSSQELTSHFLDRIDRLGGQVNAFVRSFELRARRDAVRLDGELIRGRAAGVFAGVPIGVKDTDPVRRSRFDIGSRALRYGWSPSDSPAAARIRAGGYVIVGKTATSEFAMMPIVETDLHPPCRNPWSWEHTPGGSSGGAAAAVAGGLLPLAHATDGGGSIRIPASHCNLFGIKPSRGLLPNFYGARDRRGMAGVNAVTTDVDDSAAMLDVLAGLDYDPRTPPAGSMLARSRQAPGRLKVRFATESPLAEVEPHIARGVEQVAAELEELGHDVELHPMFDIDLEAALPIWFRSAAGLPGALKKHFQPSTRWLWEQGQAYTDDDVARRFAAVSATIDDWFGDTDVWLTPTVPQSPTRIGYWRELSGEDAFRSAIPYGTFTTPFNISGNPAASVPTGFSPEGLPFGVQLVGRRGGDALLLGLARQLEQSRPWRHLRSPLARQPDIGPMSIQA